MPHQPFFAPPAGTQRPFTAACTEPWTIVPTEGCSPAFDGRGGTMWR